MNVINTGSVRKRGLFHALPRRSAKSRIATKASEHSTAKRVRPIICFVVSSDGIVSSLVRLRLLVVMAGYRRHELLPKKQLQLGCPTTGNGLRALLDVPLSSLAVVLDAAGHPLGGRRPAQAASPNFRNGGLKINGSVAPLQATRRQTQAVADAQ